MTAIEDLIKRVEALEREVSELKRGDEDDAPSLNSTYVPHGAPGPKEHEALERFLRKHNPL